jgi:hypothetical protein
MGGRNMADRHHASIARFEAVMTERIDKGIPRDGIAVPV